MDRLPEVQQVNTLALDLGTTTGFALHASGITTSGSVSFARYAGCKSKPADHPGETFLKFQRWLRERIQVDKVGRIVFENVYRWSSGDAAKAYCGYRGVMYLNAAYYRLEVTAVNQVHIKKHWTGKGNADKAAMIAETLRRFPSLELSSSDEADAIAILDLYLTTKPL